ncbi:MAG: zinc ribbon domain-containing protein [Promethearchaeota archaeon]
MSQNTSNFSTESSYALQAYGRAMYQYAVANWIYLVIAFVGVIISMGLLTQKVEFFIENMYLEEPDMIGTIVGQSIVPLVLTAASIYMLVRFIQYLISLKSAAAIVGDPDLQDHYKNEIRAILASIIASIVASIVLFLFIREFLGFIEGIDDIETSNVEEINSAMLALMMKFTLWILILFALGILTLIFRILSALKLDEWAEGLQHQYGFSMRGIKEGTNLVKWGRIAVVIPFLNYFAGIILLVGFTKAGKSIMDQFGQGTGNTTSRVGGSLETSYMPSETLRPLGNTGRCPSCGAPISEQDAGFCAMCGKKLR